MEKIEISGLGSQGCTVVITKRHNGSVYVTFTGEVHYGFPSFDKEEIEDILQRMQKLENKYVLE